MFGAALYKKKRNETTETTENETTENETPINSTSDAQEKPSKPMETYDTDGITINALPVQQHNVNTTHEKH